MTGKRTVGRVAMISMHTSPVARPGSGDAGGMNVYVLETARQLAGLGVEVDIFTRSTDAEQPPELQVADGVRVRHIQAGPHQGLRKEQLPAQMCAFTAGILRDSAARGSSGGYDLVHSHYWLSGQVGWVAAERWGVPLVHSMHTMAKVKNLNLADGDTAEPIERIIGEEQVVDAADQLIANTPTEAGELVSLYGADPERISVALPGVDLRAFSPGSRQAARARYGMRPDELVVLFVGRLQPLKAPDVLIRAGAELVDRRPDLAPRLRLVVNGGPSGNGIGRERELPSLASALGMGDKVLFTEPVDRQDLPDLFRCADVVCVPSHSESFGLVAIEAQACGIPVVARATGGLTTAVADGGALVTGGPGEFAEALGRLLSDETLRLRLGRHARRHAERFSWEATAEATLVAYREAASVRPQLLRRSG